MNYEKLGRRVVAFALLALLLMTSVLFAQTCFMFALTLIGALTIKGYVVSFTLSGFGFFYLLSVFAYSTFGMVIFARKAFNLFSLTRDREKIKTDKNSIPGV